MRIWFSPKAARRKAKGVFVGGWRQTHREKPNDGVQPVSNAHDRGGKLGGEHVIGAAGQIMLKNAFRDRLGLTRQARVISAHHTLQGGHFHNHFAG